MRYRRVLISGYLLVSLMQEGNIIHAKCIKGLPEGTRFAYAIPDTVHGIWIVVEHESFDLLKDCDIIPEHPRPELERLY